MNPADGSSGQNERGAIAYMARNGVAANLLMFLILAAGLVSLTGLVQEAFPVLSFNQIEVSVPYPGATPLEVEESIVRKIEEQVRTLSAVKGVTAIATQGRASVTAEIRSGVDMGEALNDIEAAVARIHSFPAGSERPRIKRMNNRQSVMRLVVHGHVSERTLKELAYRTEDELAALPVVSYVETSGVRGYEISIEVPRRQLRALGLTLQDVANTVRNESLDLSGGTLETEDAKILVRTTGRNYDQGDFEEIVVRARSDGTSVRLADIAEVRDGFRAVDLIIRHNGEPAVFIRGLQNRGREGAGGRAR